MNRFERAVFGTGLVGLAITFFCVVMMFLTAFGVRT